VYSLWSTLATWSTTTTAAAASQAPAAAGMMMAVVICMAREGATAPFMLTNGAQRAAAVAVVVRGQPCQQSPNRVRQTLLKLAPLQEFLALLLLLVVVVIIEAAAVA
jgi:hypothetical protein